VSDTLGPITVPDPPTIADFPIQPDFAIGVDFAPPIVTHTFDQPGLKTEQRFLMSGGGARRFRFVKNHLCSADYNALKAHWETAKGVYAQFNYLLRTEDNPAGTNVTCRYENPSASFDYLVATLVSPQGLTLLEVPPPRAPLNSEAHVVRFPDSVFATALTNQVQEIIPLITITTRAQLESGGGTAPPYSLYLSNQRVTIDGQLYLPRLIDWSGISQSIGENSDAASFNFGNADGVFTELVNYFDAGTSTPLSLYAANLQFSLFHVQSGYLVDLWAGYVQNWGADSSGRFQMNVSDGVFALTLAYPSRKIVRACWKVYKGRFCPSVSSFTDCPKDYDSCVARGVPHSFGGFVIPPQAVRIKDNSTGVFGWGRSSMTSVTVVDDTVYQRPLQEIYTDEPMMVSCDVAAGRDESDFYSALGIVGEGPISAYNADLILHTLDGQPPHDPLHDGGWRGVIGSDPSGTNDYVGISQAPWNTIPDGSTFAGGIAFAEIRRTDQKGLQLSSVSDHQMQVNVIGGIGGWVWTAPGARTWLPAISNTVWVAINVYLRGLGLRLDQGMDALIPAATMEQFFDVEAAIEAAAICDILVPKVIPDDGSTEVQFPFRGVLKEQKPLKDWLSEILNCCLGYYTFNNGKLWIGIRVNSSVLAGNAYTRAHILYKSLSFSPLQPRFNWLVGNFGDEEFGWQLNNVTVYDIDHARFLGTPDSPQYLTSNQNFVGVSNLSQCARCVTTRLREEIGGVGSLEQSNARNFQFRTTVLALQTMVGDIISLTDATMPTGYAEGRVSRWALNPDFSIDIQATATYDDMYDLVAGPKPADVQPPPVPPETLLAATGLAWEPNFLAPYAGDPVYESTFRTFALWQDYDLTADGNWIPQVVVQGEMTISQFISSDQPRIVDIEFSSGGSLNGPLTVYVAVTQRDSSGEPTTPSNLSAIFIPSGSTSQKITITTEPGTDPWDGWDLWAGLDRRRLSNQQLGASGALPTTINITGPLLDWTQGLPDASAWGVKVACKQVWHGAVCGLRVDGVTPPNQIQCNDFYGSTNPWLGRTAFVISNVDGAVPLWNFTITAFDGSTGTITVTPNIVHGLDSVQVDDVLGVYAQAHSATANTITDPMWDNSVNIQQFDSPGFVPSAEVGRLVRILRGTGAGQVRWISANDATTLTVIPNWDTIPDSTSIFIVEAADWRHVAETSEMGVPHGGINVEIRVPVPNLANDVVLVGGFLVNTDATSTDEQFAAYRMIYIFGQPPVVRIVGPAAGPYTMAITDQTIRCDTSANAITINLLPIDQYMGRTLLIFNDGANPVVVNCAAGETLFDGSASIGIPAFGNALKVTAGQETSIPVLPAGFAVGFGSRVRPRRII
jgi:hypothetical protein